MTFSDPPDRCPACGVDVDELDHGRERRGDDLHDHLADHCQGTEHMARGDRLCYAYVYGRY